MARAPGEGNFEKATTTANGIGMLLLLLVLGAIEVSTGASLQLSVPAGEAAAFGVEV